MENTKQKKERVIAMPISEYRKLKRTRKLLIKAKNNIRLAWETMVSIKE